MRRRLDGAAKGAEVAAWPPPGAGMSAVIVIREFSDPACPVAWSAEPIRLRLSWLYGDTLRWEPRMVVLSEVPEDYVARGMTLESQAAGLARMQERHGMPIDSRPLPRFLATIHACRAVVATRIHAPDRVGALLRRLRVLRMSVRLIDEPDVIAEAAAACGIDPDALAGWIAAAETEAALRADMALARDPSAAARRLDHRLSGPADARRYGSPTYEIERADGSGRIDVPGLHSPDAYELSVANLAPELPRREPPVSAVDALAWAEYSLATVEVAALCGRDTESVRTELTLVADFEPLGADGFWSRRPTEATAVRP